jgi:hypothetical protein
MEAAFFLLPAFLSVFYSVITSVAISIVGSHG